MITIISYPDNNIDESIAVPTSIDSAEMMQNIWIDVSEAGTDEYIEVIYNDETITLLITDECRYTPIDIAFQNKEGAIVFMPFFKAKTENLWYCSLFSTYLLNQRESRDALMRENVY